MLWAFAFAQPLFDLLGDNAAFFAIRGSAPIDIVVFALGLVVLPPLVLLTAEGLAGLVHPIVGRGVHLLFVAALTALFALQALDRVTDAAGSSVLVPLAVAVGAGAAAIYATALPVRSALTVLSPAPLVFLMMFLVFSPVSKLVFPGDESARVASVPARSPIVMVTFDQFPLTSLLGADGRIDAERYPNFAALATGGYWFRNTAATSDLTELAIPAILTGIRPAASALPILQDHPRNIFTLLGNSHELRVEEAVTHLCPQELCHVRRPGFSTRLDSLISDLEVVGLHMVLPSDLDDRLPSIAGKWQGFGDEGTDGLESGGGLNSTQRLADLQAFSTRREAFERFVRSVRADSAGRPALHFVHPMVPHFPFEYLPSGRSYGNPKLMLGLDPDLGWVDDRSAVERAYQRHLLQVGFVDALLGRLLRRLRVTRMYDRSLLVVTADHGATFRAGEPLLGWGASTMPDMLPVPLFIKAPGQRHGRTVDAHLQTIDILPTIADLLEVQIPWKVDGHSALAPGANRRTGLLHHPHEEPRPFSFRAFDVDMAEGLRRKIRLFGTGDQSRTLYGVGPHPELLGRLVSDVLSAAPGGLRMTLDQPGLFKVVSTRSRFVPAHVTGELHGSRAEDAHALAIALNGRIAAVTRSVPRLGSDSFGFGSDRSRFSAIVPEASFREGVNRVQVLAISEDDDRLALASLGETRRARAPFSLGDGEIRFSGHRPIRINRGSVEGFVDQTQSVGENVRFEGWALGRRDHNPVDHILAFRGGQLVHADKPDRARPDVARSFKTAPHNLGFGFSLRGELATAAEDVQIFAVSGEIATRLPYLCTPKATQVFAC
ncbi:MAG: sulfatase-like hydrolase/transferase [Thermoleophilaceae bacterium]|nr:sulfatase-like hydrolase/transferase [Thermoleophilaceae bacterium]